MVSLGTCVCQTEDGRLLEGTCLRVWVYVWFVSVCVYIWYVSLYVCVLHM